MKLRTKLLLGVGMLLFLMVLIMYILPSYFVRKDVYKAAEQIHELLIEEHQRLLRSQQLWIEDALENTKANMNALLFMIEEAPQFNKGLFFDQKDQEGSVWPALARVAGYDPSIGFVQVHAPNHHKIALVMTHASHFYAAKKGISQNGNAVITLTLPGKEQQVQTFIGYVLPHAVQKDPEYTFYALLEPKTAEEQMRLLKKEIDKLTPELLEEQIYQGHQPPISSKLRNQPAFQWASKMNLIRSLSLLYSEGPESTDNGSVPLPAGIVRLDRGGSGFGLLSKEVFSTKLLFDDEQYYQAHRPPEEASSLAEGTALVTEEPEHHAYVGNTLLLNNTYVSLGAPLSLQARQLALSTNGKVLLQVNQNFWVGFDGEGKHLPQEALNKWVSDGTFEQQNGIVQLGEKTYFFSRVISLENGNLAFYDMHLYGGENTIVSTLLSLENKLTKRISMQLSLISLGAMFLVLVFIGRLGFTVIYPITKLAAATQYVVAGRYGEVVLPDVGNRHDEVAILTRAFEEMVSGLQEREKIRGVLDKVVSKDVAEEILKTRIHLGGEDRIVTMLFCDIRGFSTLTSNLPPQKTIELLNACMTKVSRVIEGEGGVIDKYVGDEVMAIFGAPTGHPDHALRAVSTGMLIVETLKKWNQARAAAGETIIFEMGIGIHTGLVVAGNMGAEDRLNYTVLGANVNLAARLCEVAKPNQLIISAATLSEPNIKESFYTKPVEPLTPKGFPEPVQIYEIIGFKWEE
jgi:class 3 adenylate cyclase